MVQSKVGIGNIRAVLGLLNTAIEKNYALEKSTQAGSSVRVIERSGGGESFPFGAKWMSKDEAYQALWFAVDALRIRQVQIRRIVIEAKRVFNGGASDFAVTECVSDESVAVGVVRGLIDLIHEMGHEIRALDEDGRCVEFWTNGDAYLAGQDARYTCAKEFLRRVENE